MQTRNKVILLLLLIFILHAGFFWLSWEMDNTHEPVDPKTGLTMIDGTNKTLADFHGRPLLVHFWATSCRSCIKEVPRLKSLYKIFKPKGFEMVAVAMPYDRPDAVITYANTMAMPWPVALDVKGDTLSSFGRIQATPASFLLDQTGTPVFKHVGLLDMPALARHIEELLATGANKP
jgi:thiol-disulfide isomerase/thioredoxin